MKNLINDTKNGIYDTPIGIGMLIILIIIEIILILN
jgi:hypothetical protein